MRNIVIADIISALAVTVAAISVALGVNAWRREFVGKRRLELAEELLAAFYETQDTIRYIRSPAGYSGEGSTRKRRDHETQEESKVRDRAYVVVERYEQHKDKFAHLRSLKYRAMATFGENAKEPFDGIAKVINRIFLAAYMLGDHYWQRAERYIAADEGKREKHNRKMQEFEEIFWQFSDDDEISTQVRTAVETIEKIADDASRRQPTIARRFGFTGRK